MFLHAYEDIMLGTWCFIICVYLRKVYQPYLLCRNFQNMFIQNLNCAFACVRRATTPKNILLNDVDIKTSRECINKFSTSSPGLFP